MDPQIITTASAQYQSLVFSRCSYSGRVQFIFSGMMFCTYLLYQITNKLCYILPMEKKVDIEPSWAKALKDFFEAPNWTDLANFIRAEYKSKKVYPKPKDLFKAFWLTPFDQVKVVILGQDPYHGVGQAHGLCFSVEDGVVPPPSLKNIYKEIESDVGTKKDFKNGNLESWAKQGVF